MKRIFLIIVLLFQLTIVFGQKTEWTPLKSFDCYQGLQGSCVNLGYVKSINEYAWNVRIKNNYSKKVHVSFYYTVGGEKIDVGLVSIEPGGTYIHTSFYVKNNSTNYIISIESICFAKSWGGCGNNSISEMCYADCDNGTPKIPTDCGAGKTSSNSNSSSTNSDVSSNGEYNRDDFQSILTEKNRVCGELEIATKAANDVTLWNTNICAGGTYEPTAANAAILNRDIEKMKAEIIRLGGATSQKEAAQNQEQDRQQKEADRLTQKTTDFNDLINDGDAKFNEGKYNDAISKYTQAKNLYTGNILPQEQAYANDAIPIANARIAQAEKALKDAARKERVEKVYEADKKEDIAYASATASAIGIMAFLKDQYSYRQTFLKLQIGLGLEGLPLITNTTSFGISQTESSLHPTFFFGLKLGLMNKLPVNIHLTPYVQFGFNALQTGVNGGHLNGGVTGTVLASWKNTGVFKLFFESTYHYRTGSYSYDVDAVNGSTSATDEVRTGEYDYSAYNFGGGFLLDFINDNKQTYIKPGIYLEKARFYPKGIPYTLITRLEVNIVNQIVLQAEYCKYYHIGGTVFFADNFESKNRAYFGVRLIRNGNIIPVVPKKYRSKY